jgi:hypothetical protein
MRRLATPYAGSVLPRYSLEYAGVIYNGLAGSFSHAELAHQEGHGHPATKQSFAGAICNLPPAIFSDRGMA